MKHFPVACSRSKCVKKLTIINNDRRINTKVLSRMWNHFNSKEYLKPNLISFYEEIAKPLFEEFIQYKHSQIVCQILTEPNDEKGITFIKNNDDYNCLDVANRISNKGNNRILLIEFLVCYH